MGLGSQNRLRRKEFQKEAGGSKWRHKVTTIEQAGEILEMLKKHHIPDEYTKSKIREIEGFISFRQTNRNELSLQQYRELCLNQ